MAACTDQATVADELKQLFKTLDVSQDGVVDFDELCLVLSNAGERMTGSELMEVFREVDMDADGQINYTEFLGARLIAPGADGFTIASHTIYALNIAMATLVSCRYDHGHSLIQIFQSFVGMRERFERSQPIRSNLTQLMR